MTDNPNIIKEELRKEIGRLGDHISDQGREIARLVNENHKLKRELADTRTPEGQEIRYRFPQSVIDDLKSAVKIFGSLSAEQDEQLGLKGGSYMSLESLLRRAESLPEGQEMFAPTDKNGEFTHCILNKVAAEKAAENAQIMHPEFGPFKVVPVLVTKKED